MGPFPPDFPILTSFIDHPLKLSYAVYAGGTETLKVGIS
jgi:hypothetical protein